MAGRGKKGPTHFKAMPQKDVPQGRNGKHKAIVTKILSDLEHVETGVALKVPLSQLAESKEKVRSALNRATRKRGMDVAAAGDDALLYVGTQTAYREPSPETSDVGYGACALKGTLAMVFPHEIAMRPPSVVMSSNAQVSCSTLNGSVSTFIGTRATSLSGVYA